MHWVIDDNILINYFSAYYAVCTRWLNYIWTSEHVGQQCRNKSTTTMVHTVNKNKYTYCITLPLYSIDNKQNYVQHDNACTARCKMIINNNQQCRSQTALSNVPWPIYSHIITVTASQNPTNQISGIFLWDNRFYIASAYCNIQETRNVRIIFVTPCYKKLQPMLMTNLGPIPHYIGWLHFLT